jgi:ABC-2 type transport system permease protein
VRERLARFKLQYSYAAVLVRELVVTEFRVKYQSSVLGYVWSLLRPLFMFVILYVFFGIFIGAGAELPNYSSYLLLGVLLWNFFAEVTGGGVSAVVNQSAMLRKLYFPKYVVILAVVVVAVLNLIINAIVLVVLMSVFGADIRWESLLIIPLVLELALFATGVAFLLSTLYVRFRDTGYVWDILLQAGFYVTPIFYSLSFVRGKSPYTAAILSLNPLAQIIQDARYLAITTQTTTLNDLTRTGWLRLAPIAFVLVFTAWSIWVFKRRAPSFAEEV